ncbi:rifin PIR protein,putative [Plasmodium sp. DRC-Itaito]|nr:rifin PIR protein,putative [Plasmodium sp. DRC-Itaito]
MKVHYINILLFAIPLIILLLSSEVNNNKKPHTTPPHTPTTRLLCECELYMPNYDNDPQMKEVMENFNNQTQQRFREYDDRMVEKRKQCKYRCDKECQKIILKDKLEKELMDKFATLDTDIQSDAIPTCICEKSLADKVEKGCLRCGGILGAAMPELGAMGAMALYKLSLWYTEAIAKATVLATQAATKAATKAGMQAVAAKLKGLHAVFPEAREGFVDLSSIVNKLTYNNGPLLVQRAKEVIGEACWNESKKGYTSFYNTTIHTGSGDLYIGKYGEIGRSTFQETLADKTPVLEARYTAAVDTAYGVWQNAITASIIAIVIIILIMVIIYLILRRRRKKKMKKKLQYIKLLEQ